MAAKHRIRGSVVCTLGFDLKRGATRVLARGHDRCMEESWEDPDLDDLGDLDIDPGSGSAAEALQAGDDAVAALDKITAQMSGGEHRPEQQEMCRAVAEAVATRTHLVVQAGTGT